MKYLGSEKHEVTCDEIGYLKVVKEIRKMWQVYYRELSCLLIKRRVIKRYKHIRRKRT